MHSYDLILDCTANRVVRAYLERARHTDATRWPHLATMMIGHQTTCGIAALSLLGATGGGTDVLHRRPAELILKYQALLGGWDK
ncbi:hypothetical protein [Streptomyces graminofaciens]|uniref:hypothetical protein n=1 Tax=Streptomyces graminofaciens TaxID=68212 RepID=UPI00257234AA|nr:hypothetical protein [Streptomyces graminofaciens]